MEADWLLPDRIADWKLESELAFPIPRRVVIKRMFAAGHYVSLTFLAALALFAILGGMPVSVLVMGCIGLGPFVIYLERERQLSKALVSKGLAVPGFIVQREFVPTEGDELGVESVVAYGPDEDIRHVRFLRSINHIFHWVAPRSKERRPGDTLTLLYFPEAPERAKPYEDCVYKAV